jgi:hypothetical protein
MKDEGEVHYVPVKVLGMLPMNVPATCIVVEHDRCCRVERTPVLGIVCLKEQAAREPQFYYLVHSPKFDGPTLADDHFDWPNKAHMIVFDDDGSPLTDDEAIESLKDDARANYEHNREDWWEQ